MSEPAAAPYSDEDRRLDLRWWAAANYLTVAQIYLKSNACCASPLTVDDIKPRLLGHWGTSPGPVDDLHPAEPADPRAPAPTASTSPAPATAGRRWSPTPTSRAPTARSIPQVSPDAAGLTRLVRQFSTPGGIPSHVSVQTPGSIHEGGELGYALAHAGRRRVRPPRPAGGLRRRRRRGRDRPAGRVVEDPGVPQRAPRRRGAADPAPERLQDLRARPCSAGGRRADVVGLLAAQGWDPVVVAGDDPADGVRRAARRADARRTTAIRAIQHAARAAAAATGRPRRWPAIILRTPKGWTGPDVVDGVQIEGTFRAHQVPLAEVRENPEHLRLLEQWLRSYRPDELFDADGRLVRRAAALAPAGDKRMSASPYANGGRLLDAAAAVPTWPRYALTGRRARAAAAREHRAAGRAAARHLRARPPGPDGGGDFRLFCPDETASNRLEAVFEVDRPLPAGAGAAHRRPPRRRTAG